MTGVRGPCDVTARELARALADREWTATEVLAAHLERIAARNPMLRAVVSLDVDGARARAAAADAALARGETWGPLHGVPMTLKDAHEVAGLRTTIGAFEFDHVASEDGTVAARLRAAGANIMGHTNVAAGLADHSQSTNPIFGRSANPWDPARTPGGSSGGAAAALAAGMTPLEVGSDMVGSLRLPAHYCGVYGLKTTEHRVPFTGFFRPPWDAPRPVRIISSLGPMARALGDLELALPIIAGPDGRDSDVPPVPLRPEPNVRVEDLRLAVAPALPGVTVSRSVRETVEAVAARAADAGVTVDECLPDLDWAALYQLFGTLVGTISGVFNPGAELSEEQRSLGGYLTALDHRDRLVGAWHEFFARFDGLLFPPAMTSAFTHCDPGTPYDVDGQPVAYEDNGLLAAFANLTGLPALCAPAGHDENGLPIGVQIAGPHWTEMRLIAIARALENAAILPGYQAPPPGRTLAPAANG